ncbi:hypothetical protein QJS10_CPA16g01594 [Acorus calamus]|uniref:Uncharacterized protein n=1 Tax=Acorus calamus TaxID=4465 RepID=A0AAV9D1C1_ACOCL|nr:hypothetical protein QJS10_CPA16g01594 [Acorus calamus]
MITKGYNTQFVSPVSAARMFKAGVVDGHNLVPKIMPFIIKEIVVEGDGKAGSTKRVNFTDAFLIQWLGEKYESSNYEMRFEPTTEGGCVCKMVGTFNAYTEEGFTEDDINVGKNGVFGMYKSVEAYLIANPEAYA